MDVRLIAHRGYAIHAPQNSAEAFEAAGRLGFWAIETDVRRTLDGVLVCCHDATVDSMFCGSGEISALPWDALLSPAERETLSACLRSLFSPTLTQQAQALSAARDQWAVFLRLCREKREKDGKLYVSLGWLGGAAAFILLC